MRGARRTWAVRCSAARARQRRRWAFFSSLLDYGDYEGTIPKGSYGAGPAVIWDAGTWQPGEPGDPAQQLRAGKLTFVLQGRHLRGGFTLTRLRGRGLGKDWLLIKRKDAHANPAWRLHTALTPAKLRTLRERIPPCDAV